VSPKLIGACAVFVSRQVVTSLLLAFVMGLQSGFTAVVWIGGEQVGQILVL
jgi:hypothetical protein